MNSPILFLACPIGKPGSDVRIRSDKLSKYIVDPVARELNCEFIRADQIPQPGLITDQITDQLKMADVFVVDLTGLNPNVMYELGIRQALGKPCVIIADKDQELPFDVHAFRTIKYGTDIEDVETAKTELTKQVKFCLSKQGQIESARLFNRSMNELTTERSQKEILDTILNSIQRLVSSQITTEFVGNFPHFFKTNIVEAITQAKNNILIACDFPAPGIFSAAEGFEKYIQALEERKLKDDVSIKIQLLSQKRRDELNRMLIPEDQDSWSRLLNDPLFSKNLKEFNDRYKTNVTTSAELYEEFKRIDGYTFERLQRITDEPIFEIDSLLPMYVWITDSKHAIFSIPTFPDPANTSSDKVETSYGFETKNMPLINSLEGIWHWYKKMNSKQSRTKA
jgi:hypothetical protein